MFDLESSISIWRFQMLAAGIKTPVPLEELENHLREEIERQTKSGLSTQQAFAAAAQKMGSIDLLNAEFKKIRAERWDRNRKLPRRTAEFICLPLAGLIIGLSALVFSGSGMSGDRQALGLAAVILTLLAASCWRYALRFLPPIANARSRAVVGLGMCVMGFILFGIFADRILPRIMESSEQIGLLVLVWTVLPLTMVLCLGLGLAMNERERNELFEMANS